MEAVELITTAGWMFSVGDIASQIATLSELARRGVPCIPVDEPSGDRTCVIGGGHVLGHLPHLRQHIVQGQHVLNAVGAHATGDYSYLVEYKYRSVRDRVSLEIIGGNADLSPCPAVLLSPSKQAMDERSRVRGGQVVVHRDPLCERAMELRPIDMVVVDPQPNRRVPWNSGGRVLPVTHSPQIIMAELVNATCCVTRSLHLAIFALAMGTPFACIDLGDEPQSNKLRTYFDRAGIPDVMYDGDDPIHHAVSRRHEWGQIAKREKQIAVDCLDRMAMKLTR